MKLPSRRWRTVALVILGVSGATYWLNRDDGKAHPIEGIWTSYYYGACLCDAKHFFLFKDGQITGYSDRHLTEYGKGTYENLGGGTYRVTFNTQLGPSLVWEVRPGESSWVAPPDEAEVFYVRWARRFYRPGSSDEAEAQHLIDTAPERDRESEEMMAEGPEEGP